MSVNKVLLLGRLGADPEVKNTPSGSAVANFSLATSETWTDKGGEKQQRTEWHRVVVWGKLAQLCGQFLQKGSMAFVEGSISSRSYQAQDGTTKYVTEIKANAIQFLGAGKSGEAAQQAQSGRSTGLPPARNETMQMQPFNGYSDDEFPPF